MRQETWSPPSVLYVHETHSSGGAAPHEQPAQSHPKPVRSSHERVYKIDSRIASQVCGPEPVTEPSSQVAGQAAMSGVCARSTANHRSCTSLHGWLNAVQPQKHRGDVRAGIMEALCSHSPRVEGRTAHDASASCVCRDLCRASPWRQPPSELWKPRRRSHPQAPRFQGHRRRMCHSSLRAWSEARGNVSSRPGSSVYK